MVAASRAERQQDAGRPGADDADRAAGLYDSAAPRHLTATTVLIVEFGQPPLEAV